MRPTINFIGCGKLGKTIGKLIHLHQQGTIQGVLSTSAKHARAAVNFIGEGFPCKNSDELAPADIFFIATPDDVIESICQMLSSKPTLVNKSIVVHFSGALSSSILQPLKKHHCHVASIHPIKSFADPENDIIHFNNTHCAIEGDDKAVSAIKTIFEKIGATVFHIEPSSKMLYHAGSVMANNYLITLHHQAVACYKNAGIDETLAQHIISSLMKDALSNIQKLNHKQALTGPLQRGDINTIKQHMDALSDHLLIKNSYAALGMGTLSLTQHSNNLKQALENILQGNINEQN